MDPQVDRLIDDAVKRIFDYLQRDAPFLSGLVRSWATELARTGIASDYFKHILGFPAIEIPWWFERSIGIEPDQALHEELIYASINGYYFIRVMDNLMDGHITTERQMLPAAAIFHTEFMKVYHNLFPASHPFWDAFTKTWYMSAEVTTREHHLTDHDEQAFLALSRRKVCAANIPLLAICHLRSRLDLWDRWSHFIDEFGAWHLFEEDLFDWHIDHKGGIKTFFLCEAQRRKHPQEPLEQWIMREGFTWGLAVLENWMEKSQQAASSLNSRDVIEYLAAREAYLRTRAEHLRSSMQAMAVLLQGAKS